MTKTSNEDSFEPMLLNFILIIIVRIGEGTDVRCPFCGYQESRVIDSRPAEEGSTIRRRRECLSCQKRFTTYEIMERLPLIVVKKDNSRQTFDKMKIINGMIRACEKRPVPAAEIQRLAEEIEQELQNSLEREVSSKKIGELVMDKLKQLDEVAYVRFASVYRQFKDINTFRDELNKLLNED
jgi:transcriptional repressor NrdR